jgi:hypothetical protein
MNNEVLSQQSWLALRMSTLRDGSAQASVGMIGSASAVKAFPTITARRALSRNFPSMKTE